MNSLSHAELAHLLVMLGVVMLVGRLFGELLRRFNQPAVVGELIAGIVLGPTLFGKLAPDAFSNLFRGDSLSFIAFDGVVKISVILLLFIAGLEVEMHLIMKQGKKALMTSLGGLIIPFAIGFWLPWQYPHWFGQTGTSPLLFSLFLGTALSISALPVIARTLMDLKIFKTNVGMLIISSAMVDDFLGWLIFSVILGMMGENVSFSSIMVNAGYTLAFAILMITLGKRLFNLILPKINQYFSWPGGIMGVTIALAFFAAALTEHLGIHAIFGAFIMGVSLGESEHMNAKVREIIHVFVTNIFAPVFFVSIGLKVSFTDHFNPVLCLLVLVLAMAGKLIGCTLAARSSGYPWSESLVVGFGMNARGAMEIILASLALQAGLIKEDMFVALVIMALVTSMTSGPMMRWILKLTGSELLPTETTNNSV